MNIKQHAINATSTALSVITLVGGISMAQPAKANAELENMLTAVIVGAIVKEVLYDGERGEGLGAMNPYGTEHNPINERHRPGYAAGANDPRVVCGTKVIRHKNYAEQVKVNCFGQVLSTRIIRR